MLLFIIQVLYKRDQFKLRKKRNLYKNLYSLFIKHPYKMRFFVPQ